MKKDYQAAHITLGLCTLLAIGLYSHMYEAKKPMQIETKPSIQETYKLNK